MDSQNAPISGWNNTSTSGWMKGKTTGCNNCPLQNLYITTGPVRPPVSPHFTSWWDTTLTLIGQISDPLFPRLWLSWSNSKRQGARCKSLWDGHNSHGSRTVICSSTRWEIRCGWKDATCAPTNQPQNSRLGAMVHSLSFRWCPQSIIAYNFPRSGVSMMCFM